MKPKIQCENTIPNFLLVYLPDYAKTSGQLESTSVTHILLVTFRTGQMWPMCLKHCLQFDNVLVQMRKTNYKRPYKKKTEVDKIPFYTYLEIIRFENASRTIRLRSK